MKSIFTIAVSFLFIHFAYSQNVRITGTITDQITGEKIIGVSIKEKNLPNNGTSSDIDGKFNLQASSAKATLIFSYIGYITKEVVLNGNNNIVVTLSPGLLL
nr:carboxypeptidase-like regulatory domain-containing protein [Pseudopedobacter sp.]